MPERQDLEHLINHSRTMLVNAREDAALHALLAPFGYDAARLDEGLALVEELEGQYQQQRQEYAEQYNATTALHEILAEAQAAYRRHVKLARVAFEKGSPHYVKLSLGGRRPDAQAGFLAHARLFYLTVHDEPAIQEALAPYTVTVTPEVAGEALARLDAVEAAQARRRREQGEAQQATQDRNAAAARLRGYLRDFQRVAEVATEEAPQQREKLGIATPA